LSDCRTISVMYLNTKSLPPSPYKGLTPFVEKDAPFFFGRAALQETIIASLRSSHLTVIYGASGVGKSSLIGAGVVYGLNRLARVTADESGEQMFAVAVFNSWRDDPIVGLTDRVREAILRARQEFPIELSPASRSLVETFRNWTREADCELYIILDQIEEYFLYHSDEEGEGTLAKEFPLLAKETNLRANFLISIRGDAYTKLGCFEDDIPNLFDNSIAIEHLSMKAARDAIEKPIEQYNRLYAAGRRRISIDPELVETVLEQVKTNNVLPEESGRGGVSVTNGGTDKSETIEAPYLQLVMLRLWDEDIGSGGVRLSLSTLEGFSVAELKLSGAQNIVREHLFSAMDNLLEPEKEIAALVFNYLVTPSRTKIAYSVSDLAEYLSQDRKPVISERQITEVLEKLSRGSNRILRCIESLGTEGSARYEIVHDVLCPAVLEWRRQYRDDVRQREERAEAERQTEEQWQRAEQERQRARLFLVLFVLATVAAVAIATTFFSFKERLREKEKTRVQKIRSLQSGQATDDIKKIIDKNAAETGLSMEGVTKLIDALKEKLELYGGDSNPGGAVQTLQFLGGVYRMRAQQSADKAADYEQAEFYFREALDKARKDFEEDDPYLVTYLNDLGVVYYEQAKFVKAEPVLSKAMAIIENTYAPENLSILITDNLGATYDTLGKYKEAERLYDLALPIKLKSGDRMTIAEGWTNLAGVYSEQGRYDEAESYYNQALNTITEARIENATKVLVLRGLARLYRKKQEFAKAISYLDRSQDISKSKNFGNQFGTALEYYNRAAVFTDQGEFAKAEPLFKEALNIQDEGFGVYYVLSAYTRYSLGVLYYKQNKYTEAEQY